MREYGDMINFRFISHKLKKSFEKVFEFPSDAYYYGITELKSEDEWSFTEIGDIKGKTK